MQDAQAAVSRYFALIDDGRGTDFCYTAITSDVLEAQGGLFRCAKSIDTYVTTIRRRSYPTTLLEMKTLFYMVSDGITTHCAPDAACPRARFGAWAAEAGAPGVTWRTSSDPATATTLGDKVVAVVDPIRSSAKWITLYYQATDGRILRARWSTKPGSWNGSVVDTHAGTPFISGVRVVATSTQPDGSIDAWVRLRVGTAPVSVEQFHLVREGGTLRADSWVDVTAAATS
jgi:hypothetical protein